MSFLKKIGLAIFTAFYAVLFVALLAVIWCLTIVLWLHKGDSRKRFASRVGGIWGKILIASTGSRVRICGKENIPHNAQNIVYIVNHQSLLDIPLILGYVDWRVKFVARANLFSLPILGNWIKAMGSIPVSRRVSREELQQFKKVSENLANGDVMVIFPEGTRSYDGSFGKFHKTAFRPMLTALSTIVPVLIWGTYKILPRGKRYVTPTKVLLFVGKPMRWEEYGTLTPAELTEKMAEHFNEMKRTAFDSN